WHLATGQPLRIVTGDPRLTSAVTFYSPDHPDAAAETGRRAAGAGAGDLETSAAASLVTPEQLAREGFAAVCRADDEACVDAAKQRASGKANVQFITYSTSNRYLGKPGRLGRFLLHPRPARVEAGDHAAVGLVVVAGLVVQVLLFRSCCSGLGHDERLG